VATSGERERGAALEQPPFVLRWERHTNPLPHRHVHGTPRRGAPPPGTEAPPWLTTGPADAPFDFAVQVSALCADIAARCPDLGHIDVSRLLFGVTQARNGHTHGLQARVTPLRFRNGQLTRRRRGTLYQVQRFFVDAREILYLVTFCLPRFLDQDFDDKFVTLFHELYHINPHFDGDLRRHEGRYSIHSHSQKEYDGQMAQLAREYLASKADPALHAFLRLNFAQLKHRHGGVIGVVVPRPKIIPIVG
jgi:predicted metallopeptidase